MSHETKITPKEQPIPYKYENLTPDELVKKLDLSRTSVNHIINDKDLTDDTKHKNIWALYCYKQRMLSMSSLKNYKGPKKGRH